MIFCHQTSDQIIFCVDESASREISLWSNSMQLSPRQLASLQAAGNPSPEHSFKLTLLKSEIILEVARDTVGRATIDRFRKAFAARHQETPFVNETVQFWGSLNTSKAFTLRIGFGYYKDLITWDKWVNSEAFSGRYTYEFFYLGSSNFLSRGRDRVIKDTQTGEELILTPWDDFDFMPLAD